MNLVIFQSYNQKILFEDLYKLWFDKFSNFIKEKSYDAEHKHWWYTHKNLRKVVRHIENALPDMFYYLDDKNIPICLCDTCLPCLTASELAQAGQRHRQAQTGNN